MTNLTKPVRRSTVSNGAHALPLVVEMTPNGLRIREKGRRTWFGPYPWGRLYVQLARMEADARVAARRERRRAKR